MTNSPFHDPERNPLSDAKGIEREATDNTELYSLQQQTDRNKPSPHIEQDTKRLRNAFIWLLAIGASLGLVLLLIVSIVLRRTGLLDVPEPRQQTSLESQVVYVADLSPVVPLMT